MEAPIVKDPIVYDTNKFHDEELARETWYEQNESDLAEELRDFARAALQVTP